MECKLGVAPQAGYEGSGAVNAPSVAYCFTHQCTVSSGGCDKARIAELETELAAYRALYSMFEEVGTTDAKFVARYERVRRKYAKR